MPPLIVLQWRAGQLPGQTLGRRRHPSLGIHASMEGRTIARPNRGKSVFTPATASTLQWRAGQLPGQTTSTAMEIRQTPALQWRAGQLPGQTTTLVARAASTLRLQWRAGQLPGQTTWTCDEPEIPQPRFNGGPDNCPAKRPLHWFKREVIDRLQWRAGQLPGQTSRFLRRAAQNTKMLQWRAGQLPGQTGASPRSVTGPQHCFNGGPDNCPAKRAGAADHDCLADLASMEGRTIARPNLRSAVLAGHLRLASMEGRTIARPNCHAGRHGDHRRDASMEGRTIARPNRSTVLACLTCPFAGICERSWKRTLRRCLNSVVKVRFTWLDQATSGPWDLTAHRSARIRQSLAPMSAAPSAAP